MNTSIGLLQTLSGILSPSFLMADTVRNPEPVFFDGAIVPADITHSCKFPGSSSYDSIALGEHPGGPFIFSRLVSVNPTQDHHKVAKEESQETLGHFSKPPFSDSQ